MRRPTSLALVALAFCHMTWSQILVQPISEQGLPLLGAVDVERRGETLIELVEMDTLRVVARTGGFPSGGRRQGFIIAVPSTAAPGDYLLRVSGDAIVGERSATVKVVSGGYQTQDIPLTASLSRLLQDTDPKKVEEARELRSVLSAFDPRAVYHSGPFRLPVQEVNRSSGFGLVRRYLYTDGSSAVSVHNGTDFALPEGSPVRATAAGRVAMVRERIISGKTIVLEHLPGVYSLYYHLSDTVVAEGDYVREGHLIGHVGSTGLATGPHLHWELRIAGIAVDPEALVEQVDTDPLSFIIIE